MAGPECVAGWLLKYLISSSKVAANEVFAALTNETLHEGGGRGAAVRWRRRRRAEPRPSGKLLEQVPVWWLHFLCLLCLLMALGAE